MYFSHSSPDIVYGPFHKLMSAVLKSAIQDVSGCDRESREFKDAYRWCMEVSPYNHDYVDHVFSLDSICAYLRIDKAEVKKLARGKNAE